MIIVMVVGAIFILLGLLSDIPSRTFSFYTIEKYVGGDAYNAIIESSIRGGEIAAAIITRTMLVCTGVITMAIGALGLSKK